MNWQIPGLPLHPLFVHLTVVAVPVAAIAGILVAVWPRAERWFSAGAPAAALVALVSVPLATSSGEWLERHTGRSAAIEEHARLADGMLPWAVFLFVVLLLWWAWRRWGTTVFERSGSGRALVRTAAIVGPVLVITAAVGALVEVIAIGHAGAVAVWQH